MTFCARESVPAESWREPAPVLLLHPERRQGMREETRTTGLFQPLPTGIRWQRLERLAAQGLCTNTNGLIWEEHLVVAFCVQRSSRAKVAAMLWPMRQDSSNKYFPQRGNGAL